MPTLFAPPDMTIVQADVDRAIQEDIGSGDITGQLLPADKLVQARIVSREPFVLCGIPWAEAVFQAVDKTCQLEWHAQDGEHLSEGATLVSIKGTARGLVAAERTALNFLQLLSGTATITQRFAQQLAELPVSLLDTRKTIPGLRHAQKYAVRCGGGHNHRLGLFDVYLLKENHCLAFGSLAQAVHTARHEHPQAPIVVEVESIEELKAALKIKGIDRLLLDNFSLDKLRQAVAINQKRLMLEASGNINLRTIQAVAKTGIDCISVGSLTKYVYAIDLSMRFNKTTWCSNEK